MRALRARDGVNLDRDMPSLSSEPSLFDPSRSQSGADTNKAQCKQTAARCSSLARALEKSWPKLMRCVPVASVAARTQRRLIRRQSNADPLSVSFHSNAEESAMPDWFARREPSFFSPLAHERLAWSAPSSTARYKWSPTAVQRARQRQRQRQQQRQQQVSRLLSSPPLGRREKLKFEWH